MHITLNIDTATELAHVSLSKGGVVLQSVVNDIQKDHAAFLQPAISQILENTGMILQDIDAVAVTAGPGSYTGLRVGLASAKGICYALNKPLILINTLEALTFSLINDRNSEDISSDDWLCPMLDARRMEVYTAVYTKELDPVKEPLAMVLEEDSFAEMLMQKSMIFFGSGAAKWKSICKSNSAAFREISITPSAFSLLALKYFESGMFADLAMSQPQYLKEFHDTAKKQL